MGRWPSLDSLAPTAGMIGRSPSSEMAKQVLETLDDIVTVLRARSPEEIDADGALAVIAQTRSLLTIIFNRHEGGQVPDVSPLLSNDRVMTAVEYIDQHLDQKLSMPALAAVVGMSEPILARYFRETIGCSPNEYAKARRIEAAKRMIDAGDRSLADIAAECGFDDVRDLETKLRARGVRSSIRLAVSRSEEGGRED